MKILLDENLSPGWIAKLEAEGFAARPWSDFGPNDALDLEILAFAVEHKYVLLTQDLDFGIYLGQTQAAGPSVVQLRTSDTNPLTIRAAVVEALRTRRAELEVGAIITIDVSPVPRARLTLLPVNR